MRWVRTAVASVLVALVAACSGPTVDGVGSRSTAQPAVPAGLQRYVTSSPFGDPVRLELCTGVHSEAFSKFGLAEVDRWRIFGGCIVDVVRSPRPDFFVSARVMATTEADSSLHPDASADYGAVHAVRFPVDAGGCSWQLNAQGFDVVVISGGSGTDAADPARCAATGVMAEQIGTQLGTGHEPARSIPPHSVSDYDMCPLLHAAHIDRLPDLAASPDSSLRPEYLGSECTLTTSAFSFTVFGAIDADPVELGGPASSGGHDFLTVDQSDTRCRMASQQQEVGGHGAAELLVFDLRRSGLQSSGGDLCGTDTRVAALVLDAAQLR